MTHALRTTEYLDRDQQYYWVLDALGKARISFTLVTGKLDYINNRGLTVFTLSTTIFICSLIAFKCNLVLFIANIMDPDQTARKGAVGSGFILFSAMIKVV